MRYTHLYECFGVTRMGVVLQHLGTISTFSAVSSSFGGQGNGKVFMAKSCLCILNEDCQRLCRYNLLFVGITIVPLFWWVRTRSQRVAYQRKESNGKSKYNCKLLGCEKYSIILPERGQTGDPRYPLTPWLAGTRQE